ncbi:MAG: T9SS type A sorting domain-containing protein [Chitinophagaceae bacterium]|nr:T9SS type A sorting domain-containing protein [Chitinophagaceae bacterium]
MLSFKSFFVSFVFFTTTGTYSNAQIISTVVGTGTSGYNGDGIPAITAQLNRPTGIHVDSLGRIIVCDFFNHRVREADVSGVINTIAGNGASAGYTGDGGPATAATLTNLAGIFADGDNVNFCGFGPSAERICKINGAGVISTIIGTGVGGYSGDGGAATIAQCSPRDVAKDRFGNFYVGDASGHIRKVNVAGIISTIAGSSTAGYGGDGGPATMAMLTVPAGIAIDRSGNIFFSDGTNYRIRKINNTGIVTTVAGTGVSGYSGDGSSALLAMIKDGAGLDLDGLGNIFICDRNNNVVRKIDASGIITTIAGNGSVGYSGDGGMATAAQLNQPTHISIHPNGDIYFTEQFNHVVRKISYGNHIPVFTGGHIQSLAVCAGGSVPLNAALAITDADAGQTLTWTLITPPAHGVAAAAYTATATGSTVTPTGLVYIPSSGYSGTDTFEVRVDDGRSVAIVTFYVTVTPAPLAAISGTDTLCVGDTATLAGTMAGGTWSAGGGAATVSASGLCTAVVPGVATISYTFSNSCGTATATHSMAVLPAGACAAAVSAGREEVVSLFPNPACDAFVVQLPPGHTGHITVTDMTGRVVQRFAAQRHNTVHLPESGVYMVVVATDAGVWRSKVTIVK